MNKIKIAKRVLAILFIMVFAISGYTGLSFLHPGKVAAGEVIVYPSSDSYIRQNLHMQNYGNGEYMYIKNFQTDAMRAVIRVDNQLGGGNVTDVKLKLYYAWYNYYDPIGYTLWVLRLTKTFEEMGVTWDNRYAGNPWTTAGGDYSTASYGNTTLGDEGAWLTWNITAMALSEWGADKDLYVIVKFGSERMDADTYSRVALASSECGTTAHRPQVLVTYVSEEQDAEVEGTITEITDNSISVLIEPHLYGWANATVSAQVSLHDANNYTKVSAGQVIYNDNLVTEIVTGLVNGTAYDCRAKIAFGSNETAYSVVEEFTTQAYMVPSFTADSNDIEVNSGDVVASYEGNDDLMSIDYRVAYKYTTDGEWSYTEWQTSSALDDSYEWGIDNLYDLSEIQYKGQFDIGGYVYETEIDSFTTGTAADLSANITEVGISYFKVRVDYDMKDVDLADVYCKIRPVGTAAWTFSSVNHDLSGNGTLNYEFDNLQAATNYQYVAVAEWATGSTTSLFYSYLWTEDIVNEPTISGLNAQFIVPNIIRLKVNVTLADAASYNPTVYFMYRCLGPDYLSSGSKVVSGDGEVFIDLICGDSLIWDMGYDYYGVLDYTVDSIETAPDVFWVPVESFWLGTLEPIGVSGTAVKLRGQVQLGGLNATNVKFLYWVSGAAEKISTDEFQVTSSGVFTWQVGGLVYGQTYSYQAFCEYGQTYGNVVSFRAGYWDGGDGGGGNGTWPFPLPSWSSFWNFLHSTVGHWLIILFGMGIMALIFHKHRAVTLILCLMIFGLGIVIGWIDPWIIVLLAVVGGLLLWRWIAGSRERG